jgi:Tfp pilus assembly protein PilF
MQGKALHYYRRVLTSDPQNLDAIAGEGEALAEKGALEKARANLARLENLCGKGCEASRQLGAAIAKGAAPQVVERRRWPPRQALRRISSAPPAGRG